MLNLRTATSAMAAYGPDGLLRTDDLDEIREQLNEDILETSGAIRELCGAIKQEHKSLMRENILLEKSISQLKLQHVAEWNAVVDSNLARMEAIEEKIREVLKRRDQVCEESKVSKKQLKKEYGKSEGKKRYYKLIGASSHDVTMYVNSFSHYLNNFHSISNPESYPQMASEPMPQPDSVIAVIPNLNNPLIMKSVQNDLVRYQALEVKIAPLRAKNISLIQEETKISKEHEQKITTLKASMKLSLKVDRWVQLRSSINDTIEAFEDRVKATQILSERNQQFKDWTFAVHDPVWDNWCFHSDIIRQGILEELKSIRNVIHSIIKMQKE